MILAFESHGFTGTDILVILAAGGYIVDRISKRLGKSSPAELRQENIDLLRRNDELEATVNRHEDTIHDQATQLIILTDKVRELEKRDQQAVLEALQRHEISAEARYEKTKLGDERRHEEQLVVLKNISRGIATLVTEGGVSNAGQTP